MEEMGKQSLASALMDILVPCRCLHCSEIEPGAMPLGLCSRCRPLLEPLHAPAPFSTRRACDLCGRELTAPRTGRTRRCLPCMRRRSPLDRLFCAWHYQEPLDAVIQGLKFQDLTYLGKHLARELDSLLPENLEVDGVVPVPLHWRRSWHRGYNQAEEIARPLARRRGWALEAALVRRRATPPQSGLARTARLKNLRRAFAFKTNRRQAANPSKRLLLVDDVYTTGATLEAAAIALRSVGAEWVGAAVAGRTPSPESRFG